jgi:hypothetical protein
MSALVALTFLATSYLLGGSVNAEFLRHSNFASVATHDLPVEDIDAQQSETVDLYKSSSNLLDRRQLIDEWGLESGGVTASLSDGLSQVVFSFIIPPNKVTSIEVFQDDCKTPADPAMVTYSKSDPTPYNETMEMFDIVIDMDMLAMDGTLYNVSDITEGLGYIQMCARTDLLVEDLDLNGDGIGFDSVSFLIVRSTITVLLQSNFDGIVLSLEATSFADLAEEAIPAGSDPVELPKGNVGVCTCNVDDQCLDGDAANQVSPNALVMICMFFGENSFKAIKFDRLADFRIIQGTIIYEPLASGEAANDMVVLWPSTDELLKIGLRVPSIFFVSPDPITINGVILFKFGRRNRRLIKVDYTPEDKSQEVNRMLQDGPDGVGTFELELEPVDSSYASLSLLTYNSAMSVICSLAFTNMIANYLFD